MFGICGGALTGLLLTWIWQTATTAGGETSSTSHSKRGIKMFGKKQTSIGDPFLPALNNPKIISMMR